MSGKAVIKQRCVLIVSPHFPPNPLAGVHRARHLAKHLPAHGWRPIVVRAADETYLERLDPALAALVPAGVEQVRTGALDARLTRLARIGDIGLRGYFQFAAAIDALAIRERPSVVFITGAPYYPMLLARRIKRRYGIPVVLDFQDPWVSDDGATYPALSKAGLAHRLGVLLEPVALRGAAFVTSVSELQNQKMAARHPWFDPEAMAAIPIGGDPEDFAGVRADRPASETITLRYVGAFWPRAEPCLRQFFKGVAALRAASPQLAQRLRLEFIGTASSNQPTEDLPRPVAAIAREEGVGELVVETPQRAPFVEALRLMSSADGLLLIGSDEPHYTASKIYPALMSNRPYLSLFHAQSSAHAILRQAGGGRAIAFNPQALEGLPAQIAEGLAELATRPQALGTIDPAAYAPYTAHAVAGRFAAIFDQVGR